MTRMRDPRTGKLKVIDPSRNKLTLSRPRGSPDLSRSVTELSWMTNQSDEESSSDEGHDDVGESESPTPLHSSQTHKDVCALESPASTPFKDQNVSTGVNLRSLVLGLDENKAGLPVDNSFSILGSTRATSTDGFLSSENNVWGKEEERKAAIQKLGSSSLFFLPKDSPANERTIWREHATPFMRTESMQVIKDMFEQNRTSLTSEWKAKQRSALRKRKTY